MSSGRERHGHSPISPARVAGPRAVGERRAVRAVMAAARGIRNPLVLIDGPSGAGKSTLADAVRADWPGRAAVVVRLDDVYDGWTGLEEAGPRVGRHLVARVQRGEAGAWRRWDWSHDRPGALEWMRPGVPLIVEGCGAFAAGANVGGAGEVRALHVWIDAPDAARKRRALERDEGAFDPFWDLWERQWRRYVRRTAPARHVDLLIRSGRTNVDP